MRESLGDELARLCAQREEADPRKVMQHNEAVAPPRTEQNDDELKMTDEEIAPSEDENSEVDENDDLVNKRRR